VILRRFLLSLITSVVSANDAPSRNCGNQLIRDTVMFVMKAELALCDLTLNTIENLVGCKVPNSSSYPYRKPHQVSKVISL